MSQMRGGDPFLGIRRKQPVSDHDHVGHMVWPQDEDGVCRQCFCSHPECGQIWDLRFSDEIINGVMKSVPKEWVPQLADA